MNKINIEKKYQFSGHKDGVYRLEQGPEPHLFFSAAGDGMVVLWDLTKPNQGELIARLNNSIYALHYWKEKDVIILGHNYDGIHIIDWRNKKEVASLNLTDAAIFDMKIIGSNIWVATGNGTVVIADLNTLQVIKKIEAAHDRARSIDFNKYVAIGYSDNTIRFYDPKYFTEVQNINPAHDNSVFCVIYGPDSRYLYSCGRDAKIKRWDTALEFAKKDEVVAHMYTINHLTFSPNGEHFVSCSMDKSIKIWDTKAMKLLKVIDKGRHASHGTSVNRLLWTPYNNWLVSASDDHSIAVWEITF